MQDNTVICLGIESTAHTFGASIIKHNTGTKKTDILSNEKYAYTTADEGMIPHKVSEQHVQECDKLIIAALKKANYSIKDVTLISFSQSPGMGHMLRIGGMAARSISAVHKIPIIGVNHCVAHLEIGRLLTDAKDPILAYTSGANTQIIAYMSGKYRIFGETLDIGIGNFLDTFARHAGLGFPGGPKISALAEKSKNFIDLPYSVKGMDLNFGGLLTNLKQKFDSGKYKLEDLCYSLQEIAFAMVCEVTERALAHCQKDEVVLGGGVACNTRLQEMITIMCTERGAKAYFIENQYYVDNAAMIAWLGILEYNSGKRMTLSECEVKPYIRTDEIEVHWRDD